MRGFKLAAVRQTWTISGCPPSWCRTFAWRDFIRVPRPAASTSMSRDFPDFAECSPIKVLLGVPADELGFHGNTNSRSRFLAASNNHPSQPRRVMADHRAVVQQIRAHDFSLRMKSNRVHVILKSNLVGAVGAIVLGLLVTDRAAVEDYIVEANLWRVLRHRFQVLTHVVTVRFAGLSHQMVYENLGCGCFSDSVGH